MSAIKVTKGDPLSLILNVVQDDTTTIDLNDGTWTVQTKICYQTDRGAEPFNLTTETANTGILVSLSSDQTCMMTTAGTGYVLLVKCSKNDGTVTLSNILYMQVVDGIF
ncbi:hypothetical protein [Companilactobacillus sp.]|uniref:hypothetical protein n=1 Tax=Companilactobacillus sp. TaxID=2767905 RepID=UPI00260520B3|nr:hypothetical protein [Companilactobacillus sp.]